MEEKNKIYIVKYCANECDDISYDPPYPIFYSLEQNKARKFFEDLREKEINFFNEFMTKHPELINNDAYCLEENSNDSFEYNFGMWYYRYEFCEDYLDTNLKNLGRH